MPPFQYSPYSNPYVGTIADLLQRPGQAQADAALRSGQAWAGATQQIGQNLGGLIQQQADPRMQMEKLQLAQAQREARSVQVMDAALQNPNHWKADGTVDDAKVIGFLRAHDVGAWQHYQALVTQQQKAGLDVLKTQVGIGKDLAETEASRTLAGERQDKALSTREDRLGADAYYTLQQIQQHPEQTHDALTAFVGKASGYGGLKPQDGGQLLGTTTPENAAQVLGQFVSPTLLAKLKATDAETAAREANTRHTNVETENLQKYGRPSAPEAQHASFLYNGRPTLGSFVPGPTGGKFLLQNGQEAIGAQPMPAASVQIQNAKDNAWSPDQIDFYANAVKRDASQWNLVPSDVKDRVARRIADIGGDITKISESSRQMSEMAKEVLPHISTIQQEADALNKLGLLGPIGSRWRDFLAGKVGAGELAGGNKQAAELIGKFKVDTGLLKTAVARAHGGARGGGSPMMLQHMNDMFGAEKADLSTLTGELNGFKDWMQGYAAMAPGGNAPAPTAPPGGPAPAPASTALTDYNLYMKRFQQGGR